MEVRDWELQLESNSANIPASLITRIIAMNAFLTLEKLAMMPHYSEQTAELMSSLPNNSLEIRQLLSGEQSFSDAQTVTQLT